MTGKGSVREAGARRGDGSAGGRELTVAAAPVAAVVAPRRQRSSGRRPPARSYAIPRCRSPTRTDGSLQGIPSVVGPDRAAVGVVRTGGRGVAAYRFRPPSEGATR